MSQEEMKTIHEAHKRQEQAAALLHKEAFDVNGEEEDEDFAGPSLELFTDERRRKESAILERVKDVEEEVSPLPISHEVVLEGHHKAL